jgi:hypothetical protein
MRLFCIFLVLLGLISCSAKLNTEYLSAKNGRLVSVPKNLSSADMSHQYVLKPSKQPIKVNYLPPKVS